MLRSSVLVLVLISFAAEAARVRQTKMDAHVGSHVQPASDRIIPKALPVSLNPAALNGERFTVQGYSAVQDAPFCYDVVVGEKVDQMVSGVTNSWTSEKCQNEFKKDFFLGNIDKSASSSKAQHFTGGDSRLCPDGKARSSHLRMILDSQSDSLSMEVNETKKCEYDLFLKGPIEKLQPEEKKQISPFSADGKVFYILGQSASQGSWDKGGFCFCYKLEIGNVLYQHTPPVDCSFTNERCENEITIWNKVIGSKPVDSDSGMEQSYSEGTADSECKTPGKKRMTNLTMISDRSTEKLTVSVSEPDTPCAYKVQVSGPLANLVGESKEEAERKAKEEAEQKAKEEADRLEAERRAKERKAKEEAERLANEKALAEEMKARLEKAKAKQGNLTISLMWSQGSQPVDLDLHVLCPGGHISYQAKSQCGGNLDVDMRADASNPVENVFFKSPPNGKYQVYVHNYSKGPIKDFTVIITSPHWDSKQVLEGSIGFKNKPGVLVKEFSLP